MLEGGSCGIPVPFAQNVLQRKEFRVGEWDYQIIHPVGDATNVERPNHYLRVLMGGRLRILIPFARYALQSIERGLGA